MTNQTIARDIADRSGATFRASEQRTSAPALVQRQAPSLSTRPARPATNVSAAHSLGNVAELKVQVDGLLMVFVFPVEGGSSNAPAGVGSSRTDIPSALSFLLGKIVDRLRGSDTQVAVSRSGLARAPTATSADDEAFTYRSKTVLRVGPLELNLLDRTANRGGRPIDLRPREFRLLRYMMERPDKLLTRAKLLQEVWNYKFVPQTNLVDVHMGRLRRKVDGPNEAAMVRSLRGSGFVLNANPLS
jgi:DNA-binding winged helix-turn-helix (wHTH) protein